MGFFTPQVSWCFTTTVSPPIHLSVNPRNSPLGIQHCLVVELNQPPLKNMRTVKLEHFPKVWGENKKYLKPPPSFHIFILFFQPFGGHNLQFFSQFLCWLSGACLCIDACINTAAQKIYVLARSIYTWNVCTSKKNVT